MAITENTFEQVIRSELQEKGYEYLYGPDINRDYYEVILKDNFVVAMLKINPDITEGIIAKTYKTIKNFGLLKLEDINATYYKSLIESMPIPYRVNSEPATFTVLQIDFENFHLNDFNVISDGFGTRVGTITSDFTRYMIWKSENGERPEQSGVNFFATLVNGVFPKERIPDIIRNFIVFKIVKERQRKEVEKTCLWYFIPDVLSYDKEWRIIAYLIYKEGSIMWEWIPDAVILGLSITKSDEAQVIGTVYQAGIKKYIRVISMMREF